MSLECVVRNKHFFFPHSKITPIRFEVYANIQGFAYSPTIWFYLLFENESPPKKQNKTMPKNETKTLLCLVRIEMYLRYSHAKEPLDVVGLEFCRLLMLLCFVYSPTSFFNVIASQFSHSFDDVAFHAETDATLCIHHQVMTANSEILPLYFDFILFSNLQLLLCSKSVLII